MNIDRISKGDFVCGVQKYADDIIIKSGLVSIVNKEKNQISVEVYDDTYHTCFEVVIMCAHSIIAHKEM